MSQHSVSHNRHVSNGLHRRVYAAMVALAAWFILWSWIGFADAHFIDYLLAVITAFFVVAIALLALAGRQWHNHRVWMPDITAGFDDWIHGDFDTWTGRIPAREALVEVLLPLAAAALGMTGFAVIALVLAG